MISGQNSEDRGAISRIDEVTGALVYLTELPFKDCWRWWKTSNPAMARGESREGDNIVAGIDKETGEILFTSAALSEAMPDRVTRLSAFGDTLSILFDKSKRVLGLNPRTGVVRWNQDRTREWKSRAYRSGNLYVKDDKQVTAYRTWDGVQTVATGERRREPALGHRYRISRGLFVIRLWGDTRVLRST